MLLAAKVVLPAAEPSKVVIPENEFCLPLQLTVPAETDSATAPDNELRSSVFAALLWPSKVRLSSPLATKSVASRVLPMTLTVGKPLRPLSG